MKPVTRRSTTTDKNVSFILIRQWNYIHLFLLCFTLFFYRDEISESSSFDFDVRLWVRIFSSFLMS